MAADAQQLIRRLDQLKGRRTVVQEKWRQAYRYTYPLRGAGLETPGSMVSDAGTANLSTGHTAEAELLHTVGTDGARIMASALQAGLTPANSRWPALDAGDETDQERRWLDEAAESMWENIHASNFDSVAFDCQIDMSIAGQFPMFADEAKGGGYRFEEWALANTYVASSLPGEPIDTAFCEFQLTAEQACNTYGRDRVSEKCRKLVDDGKPDEQVTFVRCVYPRSGPHGQFALNLPIASVHLERDAKTVVRESGYHEMPLGVPRWQLLPGSDYAEGPACQALPDMKSLNEVLKYDFANMDLAIAGMWGAVDDGVINPRTVRIGPRKIIMMAEKENFFPLQTGGDFKVAILKCEQLEANIRKIFMADMLEPHEKKVGEQPTATATMVRVELIRQLLGPVYGRMMSEYLQWLVKRCFGIQFRANAFPPAPRSLLQRAIGVRYNSPIARAQKAVDVTAMDRYEGALGVQAQAGMADAFDVYEWDKARRKRAELLGVPAELIPDEDALAARREQKQQAAQQANFAQIAGEAMLKQAGAAA